MYKIVISDLGNESIKRISDGAFIPRDSDNRDYQQFEKDVVGIGTSCVEGADVETQISYVDARISEYPPLQEQLDKIYHDGVESWRTCLLYTSPSPRDS